jgi:hypothetical protein
MRGSLDLRGARQVTRGTRGGTCGASRARDTGWADPVARFAVWLVAWLDLADGSIILSS